MIHKFKPAAAPRVFLLPVATIVLVGGSLTLVIVGEVMVGLIALAVSAWISYYLIRYAVYQFKSYVEDTDEELVCLTSMGVTTRMEWSAVTHGGKYTTERSEVFLFLYDEAADELLTVPGYYTNIEALEQRIRENQSNFMELTGKNSDALGEALKPYLQDTDEED